jgi:hypothetical protein
MYDEHVQKVLEQVVTYGIRNSVSLVLMMSQEALHVLKRMA